LINKFNAQVNSYSHLSDNFILFTSSKISELNLYAQILARFQISSFGFSTTFSAKLLLCLNIQYFEGSSTSFTKHQYHSILIRLSISSFQNIESQFNNNISSDASIHLIADHVHLKSHCS